MGSNREGQTPSDQQQGDAVTSLLPEEQGMEPHPQCLEGTGLPWTQSWAAKSGRHVREGN